MKNFILSILLASVLLPTTAAGISFTASLISGLSPSEAVLVLADQIDSLTGRVDRIEATQGEVASTTADIASTTAQLDARVGAVEQRPAQIETQTIIQEHTIETIREIPVPGPTTTVYITPPPPVVDPDTTPPSVNLSRLESEWASSKYFSGGLYGDVGVDEWELAKDTGSGIAFVSWFIDDTMIIDGPRPISTGSFKFVLHTDRYSNGIHTLTLRVEDKEGNTNEAAISIAIKN